MVTRSIDNFEQHLIDVREKLALKYTPRHARAFHDFYRQRYERYGRSFLDYRLAAWLLEDYAFCKRVGTRWYGFFGAGGTGKSTLLKNVFYFLDPYFTPEHLHRKIRDVVVDISKFPTVGALRAVGLDEPDSSVHHATKEGKLLKEIFGEARQQKLFVGVCSTDLQDVQNYWWKKFTGVFFLPHHGKGMFFRDIPNRWSYPIAKIRRDWRDKQYKVFWELRNELGCLQFDTTKYTPFDKAEMQDYLERKAERYKDDLKNLINMFDDRRNVHESPTKQKRNQSIYKMVKESGKTQKEIAEMWGLHQTMVGKIVKDMEKNLE